jgi:hypothetical protein
VSGALEPPMATNTMVLFELPEGGADSPSQAKNSSPEVEVEESGENEQKFSYERLKVSSTSPMPGIDTKKREVFYLGHKQTINMVVDICVSTTILIFLLRSLFHLL